MEPHRQEINQPLCLNTLETSCQSVSADLITLTVNNLCGVKNMSEFSLLTFGTAEY